MKKIPYRSISELPSRVKGLPTHAQTIWMKAFNSALKQYRSEERAAKVAWGAVKNVYVKKKDKWVKKSLTNEYMLVTSDTFEFKSKDGRYFVEGYLEVPVIDSVNDLVTNECMDDIVHQIKGASVSAMFIKGNLDHEHLTDDSRLVPRAKIVDAHRDEKGAKVRTEINKYHPQFAELWGSIEDGYLDSFSMEFKPIDFQHRVINGESVRVLNKVKLGGVGFTGRPVNEECRITDFFIKSLATTEEISRLSPEQRAKSQKGLLTAAKKAGVGAKQEKKGDTMADEDVNKEEEKPAEPEPTPEPQKKEEETKEEAKSKAAEADALKKELAEMKAKVTAFEKKEKDAELINTIKETVKEEIKGLAPEKKNLADSNEQKFESKSKDGFSFMDSFKMQKGEK